MNSYLKISLAFIAGAATGAVTGILLAPEKGSKTREDLVNKGKELLKHTECIGKDLAKKSWDIKERTVKEAEELVS